MDPAAWSSGRLVTQRLVLDPLVMADLQPLHEHWIQSDVRRYLWDGETITPEQVRGVILTSDRLFEEHGAGLWAIRPPGDASLIGCGGFWSFQEPPVLELLLSFSSACWAVGWRRRRRTGSSSMPSTSSAGRSCGVPPTRRTSGRSTS